MSEVIPVENINLDSIITALKQGQTIVYPTETCYGLGCDATNQTAVDKIFKIKKRQADKPLLVLVPSEEMAREYIVWNETINSLCAKYWPGPMTVVAKVLPGSELAKGVVSDDETVAFRITDYPLAYELVQELGRPLVSTSANISSHESPYSITSVLEMFGGQENQPDIIIDGGELLSKNLSTIVKVSAPGKIEILRQGGLVVEI